MNKELLYIPNLITLSRILLSPLVLVVFDNIWLLFLLGLYTGVSDYFDGYYARKLNQSSALGATLDPIADKLLVLMFIIAAVSRGMLAPWMLLGLFLRDLYTFGATVTFLLFFKTHHGKITLEARLPGKIVTLVQFLSLALLTMTPREIWTSPAPLWHWRNFLFLSLYPLSIWAAIDYQRHYWSLTRR